MLRLFKLKGRNLLFDCGNSSLMNDLGKSLRHKGGYGKIFEDKFIGDLEENMILKVMSEEEIFVKTKFKRIWFLLEVKEEGFKTSSLILI